MRTLLLVLLTGFFSITSYAKCTNSGIWLLSKQPMLNKNGLIILEFYASSQLLVPGLTNKYPVYLKSKKSKIKLLAVETLNGEFEVTQVIFKPASELTVGETYELMIDNLPSDQRKPEKYNERTKKWEAFTFKIAETVDIDIPVLTNTITEVKKMTTHYGCGPERIVVFAITGTDRSEVFVRARVKSKSTGNTTDYLLAIEDGQVQVGHGMCSGAFHFDEGDKYEVIFSLLDQSGNTTSPLQTLVFTKPA